MSSFKNILFPTDFSPHARSALKYAAAFARAGHGRVVLFSVQTGKVPANLMTLPEHVFEDQDSKWLLDLRHEVKSLLKDPMFSGLDVEPVIVEGEPADEIAKAVRHYDIDLVTVVTHGRRGLSRAMFGSTAEEIIRLNRVLLATNFRPSSIPANNVARELVDTGGAEGHVVYVIGDYFEQISVMFPEGGTSALTRMREEVKEHMDAFARERGHGMKAHVVEGRPYAEIVRLAAEIDADLIVIGTTVHASLFGGAPALGSEIERVVRNAPCPVLCVPSGKVVTPLPAFAQPEPVPQT
jgi:nucleotide-binding universal stress UspA family protein